MVVGLRERVLGRLVAHGGDGGAVALVDVDAGGVAAVVATRHAS